MINKIITEQDFLAALNRVDTLMFNALPGTPEGDELEKLSKLIEDYENQNSIIMSKTKVDRTMLHKRFKRR